MPILDLVRLCIFFLVVKRAAGALGESDSVAGPQVTAPNYDLGNNNCLAHANTHSMCCINECVELFGKLERGFVAPHNLPEDVFSSVTGFSSSTAHGPRNLSQIHVRRLHEVAAANGSLLAQWMHQAFPHECPYPHLLGTTTSLNPSAWAKSKGQLYRLDDNWTRKEMRNQLLNVIDSLPTPTNSDAASTTTSSSSSALAKSKGQPYRIDENLNRKEMRKQTLNVIDVLSTPTDSSAAGKDDVDLKWTSEEELLVKPTSSLTARLRALFRAKSKYLRFLVPGALCAILALTHKLYPHVGASEARPHVVETQSYDL